MTLQEDSMKRIACLGLLILILLSACSSPSVEVTPESPHTPSALPTATWWVAAPTLQPTPPEDSSLSYEDFFAQKIEYIDTNSDEPYFSPVDWNLYASTPEAAPGLALAQELVTEDTLGWIPLTLSYTPDGCLCAFWAGTEEGASLYRLYYPTKTLECLYSITAEEVEQRYYYTPQTEDTAYLFRSNEHPKGVVGERVCLMGYVDIYTNQEFLWGSYDPDFLTLLDDMSAHKEDYPQYPEWFWDTGDIVDWVEGELSLKLCHYFNAATGECRVRKDSFYGAHNYWWVTDE